MFWKMIWKRLKSLDPELLEEVIFRCAGDKSKIVEKDEKDQGLRNILNYGHTIGHAIETVSDFKIKHGSRCRHRYGGSRHDFSTNGLYCPIRFE